MRFWLFLLRNFSFFMHCEIQARPPGKGKTLDRKTTDHISRNEALEFCFAIYRKRLKAGMCNKGSVTDCKSKILQEIRERFEIEVWGERALP